MKKFLLSLVVLYSMQAAAQQLPIVRQYMLNKTSFNPAFAGGDENISIAALYSHQWAGFNGAPHTIFGRIHAPIGFSHVALGLYVYNEQLGVHNNTNIAAQFAYRINLRKGRKLVIGVDASVGVFRDKASDLTTTFGGDETYRQDLTSVTYNTGVGLAFYDRNFWIGASVPQLLRNYTDYGLNKNKIKAAKFNFTLAAGYNIRVKQDFSIEPSFIMRHSATVKFLMDVNVNFKYKDVFWAGPFYRINAAYGLMLGVAPVKWLKISYAGEVAQQMALLKNNYGTHEVMLGFNIVPKGSKVSQSPRYF